VLVVKSVVKILQNPKPLETEITNILNSASCC